jgi:hypothetical protein
MKTSTKRRTTSKVLKEVPKDPNQRAIKSLFPTRKALRKSLAPTYYPVDHHIYYDGCSFRVRVRTAGKTLSWNTPDKAQAIEYRDYQLLARNKRKLLA